jgi:hypothetical protein
MKSMGRDEQTETNKQETKQNKKNTHTKTPGSGKIEFQSQFKFWCYSSSRYLSRSSVIVSPGGWVVFFFCFVSEAAA